MTALDLYFELSNNPCWLSNLPIIISFRYVFTKMCQKEPKILIMK